MSSFAGHMTCVHALRHNTALASVMRNFNKKIDRKNINFGNKTAIFKSQMIGLNDQNDRVKLYSQTLRRWWKSAMYIFLKKNIHGWFPSTSQCLRIEFNPIILTWNDCTRSPCWQEKREKIVIKERVSYLYLNYLKKFLLIIPAGSKILLIIC